MQVIADDLRPGLVLLQRGREGLRVHVGLGRDAIQRLGQVRVVRVDAVLVGLVQLQPIRHEILDGLVASRRLVQDAPEQDLLLHVGGGDWVAIDGRHNRRGPGGRDRRARGQT